MSSCLGGAPERPRLEAVRDDLAAAALAGGPRAAVFRASATRELDPPDAREDGARLEPRDEAAVGLAYDGVESARTDAAGRGRYDEGSLGGGAPQTSGSDGAVGGVGEG